MRNEKTSCLLLQLFVLVFFCVCNYYRMKPVFKAYGVKPPTFRPVASASFRTSLQPLIPQMIRFAYYIYGQGLTTCSASKHQRNGCFRTINDPFRIFTPSFKNLFFVTRIISKICLIIIYDTVWGDSFDRFFVIIEKVIYHLCCSFGAIAGYI